MICVVMWAACPPQSLKNNTLTGTLQISCLLQLCLHLRHPHLVISNMEVEILSLGLDRLAACVDGNLPAHAELRHQELRGFVPPARAAHSENDIAELRQLC